MDEQFNFDEPIECINRAIRGLDRLGFDGKEKEALDYLQLQFTNYTRDELQQIYRQYGDVQDFEI